MVERRTQAKAAELAAAGKTLAAQMAALSRERDVQATTTAERAAEAARAEVVTVQLRIELQAQRPGREPATGTERIRNPKAGLKAGRASQKASYLRFV